MKRLLINGCSFGECWNPTQEFIESLGCDITVNISKVATSFQRTCRSTVEWIAQNGNPDFVIIPITFAHRWELSISENEDTVDGAWFPLQRKELLDSIKQRLSPDVSKDKVMQLIDLYHGVIPTIKTYWDKIFTEIILLSAFLESKKIKHLFFDMCNEFEKRHIKGYKGFSKVKLIEDNRNVIDLFSFCGNRYMWQSMTGGKSENFNVHHAPEQYKILEKKLIDYINTNI